MKLAVITDLHDTLTHADRLHEAARRADAVVVCGDLTTFGDRSRMQAMADAVRPRDLPAYFVPGNCDRLPLDGTLDGWQNVHGRVLALDGWLVAGVGGSLACPGRTPNEYTEETCASMLNRIRAGCGWEGGRLILVSHQPPFGTAADRLPSGRHVGCRALRAFIDEIQPACCLTGHIHEAASRTRVGRTLLLNPGPFAEGRVDLLDLGA